MRHRIYSNTIVVSYESYDWIVVTIFSRSQSFSGHSILCFCNGTWQHDNVWYGHHWILLSLVSISKSNWSLCTVCPRRETIMTRWQASFIVWDIHVVVLVWLVILWWLYDYLWVWSCMHVEQKILFCWGLTTKNSRGREPKMGYIACWYDDWLSLSTQFSIRKTIRIIFLIATRNLNYNGESKSTAETPMIR